MLQASFLELCNSMIINLPLPGKGAKILPFACLEGNGSGYTITFLLLDVIFAE